MRPPTGQVVQEFKIVPVRTVQYIEIKYIITRNMLTLSVYYNSKKVLFRVKQLLFSYV